MKKILIVVLGIFLVACQNQVDQEVIEISETIEIISDQFLKAIEEQKTEELLSDFIYSDEMKKAMTETLITSIYDDIESNYGDFVSVEGHSESENNGYDIISINVEHEMGFLVHNIVFDSNKMIAGYNYRESQSILTKEDEDQRSIEEIAYEFIIDLKDEDTQALLSYQYHDEMKSAFNEVMIKSIYNDLDLKLGSFMSIESTEVTSQGLYDIVAVTCHYEFKDASINVVFTNDKLIAGLNYFEIAKETTDIINEKDVIFASDEYPLNGKLTLPESESKVPAVILVHGSGPNDMDEGIYGNKPFKDIAEGLYQQGIAVLRYDKRTYTYGKQILQDGYEDFTIYDETIDDAVLAVDYLKSLEAIDSSRVFVMGHSLGANVGPLIAKERDLAGLLLVAGNVTPLHDLMVEQFDYIYNIDGQFTEDEKAASKVINDVRDRINSESIEDYDYTELFGIPAKYWLFLRDYNPVEVAQTLDLPIALFQGGRDYQVPLREYELWVDGLEEADAYLYESLNHLMISGQGQSTPEEYMTAGNVDENFIKDMADFINSN